MTAAQYLRRKRKNLDALEERLNDVRAQLLRLTEERDLAADEFHALRRPDFYPLRQFIGEFPTEQRQDILRLINTWLVRGDGVAIYTNQELGHPDLGHVQCVSYGSDAAQLPGDTPPTTLPDIGGRINWRYQLTFSYRGHPVVDAPESLPESIREEVFGE